MALTSRPEVSNLFPALQQEIARLAALAEVRSAFAWFLSNEDELTQWQLDLASIPAPPFGEQGRSEWLRERFLELGLGDVGGPAAAGQRQGPNSCRKVIRSGSK